MASGTTEVDFGVFPGALDASVAVTGQANIVAGSLVEAWIRPVLSSDSSHSADEHIYDPPDIVAGNIVGATGFTIYATSKSSSPHFGKYVVAWAGNWT